MQCSGKRRMDAPPWGTSREMYNWTKSPILLPHRTSTPKTWWTYLPQDFCTCHSPCWNTPSSFGQTPIHHLCFTLDICSFIPQVFSVCQPCSQHYVPQKPFLNHLHVPCIWHRSWCRAEQEVFMELIKACADAVGSGERIGLPSRRL